MELERYFNFAAVWAFGGTLEAECRESFSNWWKEQFEQHIDYPEEGTVRSNRSVVADPGSGGFSIIITDLNTPFTWQENLPGSAPV